MREPGSAVSLRVFISYAQDDDAQVKRVREFWLFLRAHGVDARLDLPAAERRQDWAQWMQRDLNAARSHHQAGLDIRTTLTTADPANTQWQRDLSFVLQRMADLEARATGS